MTYAIVIDGVVTNVISLLEKNASEFPNAVNVNDRPVAIGDSYDGEKFWRDGEEVLTYAEMRELADDVPHEKTVEEIYAEALNMLGVETEEVTV